MVKYVICLSEAGWRGMRRCSLMSAGLSIPTVVFINAHPSREIQEIIEPKPSLRNYFFPRVVSRVGSYLAIILLLLAGRVRALVVEKKRTLAFFSPLAKLFSVPVFFLKEVDRGFELFLNGEKASDPKKLMEEILT